ncbi:MAG TPA: endolytic transglycosylase MltG [Gammaproteobacteria bacterium]|nr:endolytic transglycosylase MltG [Gammaproteobacteria bacterium]
MAPDKRRIVKTLAGLILMACLCFLVVWIYFLRETLVTDPKGVRYTVRSGASFKSVTDDLVAEQIIHHPFLFEMLASLKRHELKSGDYLFRQGTTSQSLLNQITTGTGLFHYTFTIIAGWNFQHLRDVLLREPDLQHTTALMTDAAIMTYLGQPTLSPEGRFYPDTYFFAKGSSDLLLLKRAYQKMQRTLDAAWQKREPGLPYQTQNEALTVASLVEKETPLARERVMIAGVIINRLKKDMLLQMDPTVIYAAGAEYNGTIYKKELMADNPYNTYRRKGLPPTPIAIPGKDSITAALHPAHHDYYYFVAKNSAMPGEGHQFSKTLAEHEQVVALVRGNSFFGSSWFNDDLIRLYFLKRLEKDTLHANETK